MARIQFFSSIKGRGLLAGLLLAAASLSHADILNGNFENGLANWTTSIAYDTAANVDTNSVGDHLPYVVAINPGIAPYSQMNAGSPGLSTVHSGNSAAKLYSGFGENNRVDWARLQQTGTVPMGQCVLEVWMAMVLPGYHYESGDVTCDPYVEFNVFGANGATLYTRSFRFGDPAIAPLLIDGSQSNNDGGPFKYLPWTRFEIDLSAFNGQNITIAFTANKCCERAHFSYVYIDDIQFRPCYTPTVTRTPSVTRTPTITRTATSSPTATSTLSFSATSTLTATRTATPSLSATATASPSYTFTATATPTRTITPTATPSATRSATPTETQSNPPTATATATRTVTSTATVTATKSATPTATATRTVTSTATDSATQTSTRTATPTATASPTQTATATFSATATVTVTRSATPSSTATATHTATATATRTFTSTATQSASPSATSTGSPSASPTATSSATRTATNTATQTATMTATRTATATATPSATVTATSSVTPSVTHTPTITLTSTPALPPDLYYLEIAIYNSAGEKVRTLYSGRSLKSADQLTVEQGTPSPGQVANVLVGGVVAAQQEQGIFWDGSNDNGQPVANGVYVLKIQTKDPFDKVMAVNVPITVLGQLPENSLSIFNSAGELVRQINLGPAAGVVVDMALSSESFAPEAGRPESYLKMDLRSESGAAAQALWDGLNSLGQPVAPGTYLVKLLRVESGARHEIKVAAVSLLRGVDSSLKDLLAQALPLANPWIKSKSGSQLTLLYPSLPGMSLRAQLYDVSGQRVGLGEDLAGTGRLQIDLARLAHGVYFIEMQASAPGHLSERRSLKIAIFP